MMARGGDGLLKRMPPILAHEQAGLTPGFAFVETVETVAGADAGFAAGTAVQVHLEGELFAGPGGGERNQAMIVRLDLLVSIVPAREAFGGAEVGLFRQQRIDQRLCLRVSCGNHWHECQASPGTDISHVGTSVTTPRAWSRGFSRQGVAL